MLNEKKNEETLYQCLPNEVFGLNLTYEAMKVIEFVI